MDDPAEQFDIKEIRPLSLNDIALPDSVRLDKRTVAAILDIPSFWWGKDSSMKRNGTTSSIPVSVRCAPHWSRNSPGSSC